jgi:hypothetical protein
MAQKVVFDMRGIATSKKQPKHMRSYKGPGNMVGVRREQAWLVENGINCPFPFSWPPYYPHEDSTTQNMEKSHIPCDEASESKDEEISHPLWQG